MTPASRWEAGLAAVLMVAGALLYGINGARRDEASALVSHFYRPLRGQGISLKGDYVAEHLRDGNFSEWTHLHGRALLQRWQHRDVDPNAVGELVARWQGGLWRAPQLTDVQAALAALEAQWQARLDAAAPLRDLPPPEAAPADAGEYAQLRFQMNGADPARLGARFILVSGFAEPPVLYWSTTQLRESGFRRQLPVEFEVVNGASRATYDLGAEPGWIAPNAALVTLRFDGTAGDGWAGASATLIPANTE